MSVATISFIHPGSDSKGERIQSLLTSQPASSSVPTRTHGTASTRPKAPAQQLSQNLNSNTKPPLLIAAVTVQSSQASQDQQPIKDFQKAAADENLFSFPQEDTQWSVAGGFVSRDREGKPEQGGKTLMLARFECKDSGESRDKAVEILSKFAAWVRSNEPDTLTYAVLARLDEPDTNQVMMFERYTNPKAIGVHSAAKEFKAMFKAVLPYINPKKTRIFEFIEGKGAVVGSGEGGRDAKL